MTRASPEPPKVDAAPAVADPEPAAPSNGSQTFVAATEKPKPTEADRALVGKIADAMLVGDVVPFLGAGASIAAGLPSAKDLAEGLLTELLAQVAQDSFPDEAEQQRLSDNLALTASFLTLKSDSLTLARRLREAFNVSAKPGKLHKLLATVKTLELVVTTNYDDLIEQAFQKRKPWVMVDHGEPGEFWLRGEGKWAVVQAEALEKEVLGRKAPIIYKMHGNLDRQDREYDWFLITEEHYVDFLGRKDTGQVPQMLATIMKKKNFLFLGYGLQGLERACNAEEARDDARRGNQGQLLGHRA